MKNNYIIKIFFVVMASVMMPACSKQYLKPDPLSFYEPEATFSTKSGLDAAIAMCDKHLRSYWSYITTRDISVPINTEYMLSDMAVSGKTDDGSIFADVATRLTPTDGMYTNDVNMMSFFWEKLIMVSSMPIPSPRLLRKFRTWMKLPNVNISAGPTFTDRFATSPYAFSLTMFL